MKQITIRELRRLASATSLREAMPCEVTSDGEVIGYLVPRMEHDVRQPTKATTKCDKLTELPLSKHKQAQGQTAQLASYVPY